MNPLNQITSSSPSLEALQTLLDPIYAGIAHAHAIADVTDLQAALDAKAADSSVVKLTGNQSVAGVKTFTGNSQFAANINLTGSTDAASVQIIQPTEYFGRVRYICSNSIWFEAGAEGSGFGGGDGNYMRIATYGGMVNYSAQASKNLFWTEAYPSPYMVVNCDLKIVGSTRLGPITFATLPSASANAGVVYRVTDRNQKHCYSDGTNWLWFHDNSTAS